MGSRKRRMQAARVITRALGDQSIAHTKAHALVAARMAGDDAQSLAIVADMDLDEARAAAWMVAESVAVMTIGQDREPDRALEYFALVGAIRGVVAE